MYSKFSIISIITLCLFFGVVLQAFITINFTSDIVGVSTLYAVPPETIEKAIADADPNHIQNERYEKKVNEVDKKTLATDNFGCVGDGGVFDFGYQLCS